MMTKNGNILFVVLFDNVTIPTQVSGAPLSSFILAMVLYIFFVDYSHVTSSPSLGLGLLGAALWQLLQLLSHGAT